MIDESREEEAIRYVLGEFAPGEAAAFEAALANDPELREFESGMRASLACLALDANPIRPLPAVLERILEDIAEADPAQKVVRVNWLPWALAAAFAISCTLLAVDYGRLSRELAGLKERDALAEVRIATLGAQAEAYARAGVVIVWDPETQRGVLKLSQLPPAAADKDYQLWLIDPATAQPVSAGVVSIDPGGSTRASFRPTKLVGKGSKFAVSIEGRGGSIAPQGEIIFVGE